MAKHHQISVSQYKPSKEECAKREARLEKDFKRGYEFTKKLPARVPVDRWGYENVVKYPDDGFDWPYDSVHEKEKRLIIGTPSDYRGEVRQGKLRLSGNKSAHQIGKRKR